MEQNYVIWFIIDLFALLYPPLECRAIANKTNMILWRTIFNATYYCINLFLYILFFYDEYEDIFLILFSSTVLIIIIIEFLIFNKIYRNRLEKRIKNIPNYYNLSIREIRNELIRIYDEAYSMILIEKVLRKMGIIKIL